MKTENSKEYVHEISHCELGKKSSHQTHYNPDVLFAIPRVIKREEIGITSDELPFHGFDCWNHYEVSWLNDKGKPKVGIAEIFYDCTTPNIIESKSLKLYFNSLNNEKFSSETSLQETIKKDLENHLESDVIINLFPVEDEAYTKMQKTFSGICLDNLDITCDSYSVNPQLLSTEKTFAKETLYSHLLRSNCLITNQPDWGSIFISYEGPQINHEGLLHYLISFRNHNEFHEQCIERIFMDIMKQCHPKELTVYGRYTRRGGLDINPYRSTQPVDWRDKNVRLARQ